MSIVFITLKQVKAQLGCQIHIQTIWESSCKCFIGNNV